MSLDDIGVTYVENLDDAQRFLAWIGERRPILAIDTETTGLQWWTPAFLRLVQFGDGAHGWALAAREWRAVIRRALHAIRDSGQPVVMHNAPFDQHALDTDGLPFPDWHKVHDTKIMDHLLDPLRPHGLKPMSDRLFGPRASSGQALLRHTMSVNGWSWDTVPEDHPHYWAYGALDTCLTAKAAEVLWPQVCADPQLRAAYDREMQTQAIMWRAEKRGMRVDVDYTARLRSDWQLEAERLRGELADLGIKNPSSNRQIEKVLKDAGWEPEEFTATGAAKLDKVILAQLAQTYGPEVAPRVLRYKRLVKWDSAYLVPFLGMLDANGRIHCSVNTMAARTGRSSITNPALQTLPRGPEIKNCLVACEGKWLVEADFDGQEARLFAHYCGDDNLIRAFLEGLDVHRYAAAQTYGVPMESVTADQRQVAKAVTFAKLYGAGAARIADTAGISQPEAEAFIARYEAAFPDIPAFMRQVENIGRMRLRDEGRAYVRTWGGRLMVAPEDATYRLVNGVIQGSGADLLKQKMVDIDAAGYGDLIALPVHDSLVFEVDDPDVRHELRTLMEEHEAFRVPITVHISEPTRSWGGTNEAVSDVQASSAA